MTVIDDYLANFQGAKKDELQRVRLIVRSMLPDAQEVITYKMPGFKYKGKYLLAFNIFKDHLGLYPTSGPIVLLKNELKGYKTSSGTIQFTVEKPLPEELIKKIVLARVDQIEQA